MANVEYDLDCSGGLMEVSIYFSLGYLPSLAILNVEVVCWRSCLCLIYLFLVIFGQLWNIFQLYFQQIQKLVAPPESAVPQKRRRVREYRRQGRSVNHDCCDSCKEGGDLLCCDRCPAAFHLQCQ